MATQAGLTDRGVLIAILVELRVLNKQISESNGTKDELLLLRADEERAIGYMNPDLSQKDS